jgi:hypothetical protein
VTAAETGNCSVIEESKFAEEADSVDSRVAALLNNSTVERINHTSEYAQNFKHATTKKSFCLAVCQRMPPYATVFETYTTTAAGAERRLSFSGGARQLFADKRAWLARC